MFPGNTSWRSLRTLSDCEPASCELVRAGVRCLVGVM